MKSAAVALAVSKVGAGGTARLLTELMLVQDKKCTSVVSLIEYLYTALLSSHVLLRRRQLPLSCHAQLLLTGVGATVLSNWAMESDVPVAIRLILKNGQLSANMAVGAVLLRRRYSAGQVAAIGAITFSVGTVQLTLIASGTVSDYSDSDKSDLQENIAAVAGVDNHWRGLNRCDHLLGLPQCPKQRLLKTANQKGFCRWAALAEAALADRGRP